MKKTLVKSLALAFVGSLLVAGSAMAVPISGQIDFISFWQPSTVTGGVWSNSTLAAATAVNFTPNTVTAYGLGDFAVIDGMSATLTDFEFYPGLNPSPVAPLWSVDRFSFQMNSITVNEMGGARVDLSGHGILIDSLGVYDQTIGDWQFTTQGAEGNTARISFSANQVPEPSTMLLLGTGLAGLAGVSRRRKTQN